MPTNIIETRLDPAIQLYIHIMVDQHNSRDIIVAAIDVFSTVKVLVTKIESFDKCIPKLKGSYYISYLSECKNVKLKIHAL